MTLRLPDDQHARLRDLAARDGVSVNKLMERLATQALAEFDAENRFRAAAARGDVGRALRLLEGLDQGFAAAADPEALRRQAAAVESGSYDIA